MKPNQAMAAPTTLTTAKNLSFKDSIFSSFSFGFLF